MKTKLGISRKLVLAICFVAAALPAMAKDTEKQSKIKPADDVMAFHKELIVIDGVVPLLGWSRDPEHFDWFIQVGATAIGLSASGAVTDPNVIAKGISWYAEQVMTRDDLMLIRSAEDIRTAKKEGEAGCLVAFPASVTSGTGFRPALVLQSPGCWCRPIGLQHALSLCQWNYRTCGRWVVSASSESNW